MGSSIEWRLILGAIVLISSMLIATTIPSRAFGASEAGDAKPYTVQCTQDKESGNQVCKVDKKTFTGWRTYHGFCHQCHGPDAIGSTFAPNLVELMKDLDKKRYMSSMDDGYTGQIGVMPGFKENPNVSKRYEELYAYLMARADGELGPGRPQRLK